jgi:hypothetical protein
MRLLVLSILATCALASEPTPIDRIFHHMYEFDMAGAHALLDQHQREHPEDPMAYSVRAAVLLFGELDRLGILETDFFMDDDNVSSKKKLRPDPRVRERLFESLSMARQRAAARLATNPDDKEALFALCMSSSITADYTVLVERRQWKGFSMARETHQHAKRLLAFNPPCYDAYLTEGSVDYVIASMPFFLRWLVRFDNIQGDKQAAADKLRLVAERGHYYAPFARILLAVIYLREKQPQAARRELLEFQRQFPNNPLVKRELARIK